MLKGLRDFRKDWDFSPTRPWPLALPAFAYKDQLLCGFEREEGEVIALRENNLLEALHSIHPELSFMELARLQHRLPLNSEETIQLWGLYGYRWRESLGEIVKIVLTLPVDIQRLIQEKKLGPNDLAPLKSIPDLHSMAPYWPSLILCHASKSELIKILELLVELILLNKGYDEILPTALIPAENGLRATLWLPHLQKLRFPLTTSMDEGCEKKIKSVHWPLRSEARWTRRGDLSGVELKMFFSHPQEFKRSLMKLEQINEDFLHSEKFEDLWSRS